MRYRRRRRYFKPRFRRGRRRFVSRRRRSVRPMRIGYRF